MRTKHFEALAPVCPRCALEGAVHRLGVGTVARIIDDVIYEASLVCGGCHAEYPVIDGIPIIVRDVREYIQHQVLPILCRGDLSALAESMIGDALGPGTPYDSQRQHLSTYARDHYGDFDPQTPKTPSLHGTLQHLPEGCTGHAIDFGCATGRTAFELTTRTDGLVVGIDMNFHLLRLAQEIGQTGRLRYNLRRMGVVYERREFDVDVPGAERVDFWVADAIALPFTDDQFGLATSLNLLDCVSAPQQHLFEVGRVLAKDGQALLSTPFDWAPTATPIDAWIGGHSSRQDHRGDGGAILEASFGKPEGVPGLALVSPAETVAWTVNLTERSEVQYEASVYRLRATGAV